jgi:adenosylcobinamide hydrolase
MFEYERGDDRLTLRREGTRWLCSGFDGDPERRATPEKRRFDGGFGRADAAHNLTVPEGFDRTDLAAYAAERLEDRPAGPTLLTGVSQRHARGARCGPVEVVATAGVSNPAALPVATDGGAHTPDGEWTPGTVNLFVGTTRRLGDAAAASLLATAVEAKAATLLAVVGVPGTTSDAVVVGSDPAGDTAVFTGSATTVGAAARACVRDAVLASLGARYDDDPVPDPDEAQHGVVTDETPSVFELK